MLSLTPADFTPLADFRLRWRFEGPHYDLTRTEKSSIRPLSAEAAERAMAWASTLHGSGYADRFEEIAELRVDGRFSPALEQPVAEWLEGLLPALPSSVIVSYDRRTALATSRHLFVSFWGAFLFPVEDVIVAPPDASWTLSWDHRQTLCFARARA